MNTLVNEIRPGSDTHTKLLTLVRNRLRMSENKMSKFYGRWRVNEQRVQAYVSLPDYEALIKKMNTEKAAPAKPISIVVPYVNSAVMTIATYLLHTFAGQKPIFQLSTTNARFTDNARNMEIKLQYDCDHIRIINVFWQLFVDAQIYGCAPVRVGWLKKQQNRTMKRESTGVGMLEGALAGAPRMRQLTTVYEGNEVTSIDPFMFFPDPRFPMMQVNRRGEFVFWRSFEGRHKLKRMQAEGIYAWTESIPDTQPRDSETGQESARGLLSQGDAGDPSRTGDFHRGPRPIRLDEGTIELNPADYGIEGEEGKWHVVVANDAQIIRFARYDSDHDMHPVAVAEPGALGAGFGQPGIVDFVGPLQEMMSWLVNSHVKNVNTAINNMFVVDPSMIEMQDLKTPTDGRIIRMKKAAYGQDVRSMLSQLQVVDVTRGHLADLELFMRLADSVSGANENLRGIQRSGGRKTATEVRTSGESGASRLAAIAKLCSAQAISDIAEQMTLNNQQYLSPEFSLQLLGDDALRAPITADSLDGLFTFPVSDGTLPMDRVAMLDVWREIFAVVLQDQEMRMTFSAPKMFEWIAELGGAKNIEQFKISAQDPGAIAAAAAQGNLVPVPPAQTGAEAAPGRRLAMGPGAIG